MANTSFKTEYGLLVVGDSTLLGNVSVANASFVSANNVLPVSNSGLLGNNTLRWNISGNTVTVSNTLTVTSNLAVATNLFVVDVPSAEVGIGTATPDAKLSVVGTANVSGASRFGNTVTIVGNAAVGTTLFVSTQSGSERVGINNNASNTLYALAVGGNTIVNGILTIASGKGYYLEADQLKVNTAIQLGSNVIFTFAGSILGDVLPAYRSGTLTVTTAVSNSTVVVTTGNTDPLIVGFAVTGANIPVGATVTSIVNSTSFNISAAPTASATNVVLTYYSRLVGGQLASYSLGSSTDANTRWDIYAKTTQIDEDITVGGKLTLSNTTTTHVISANVNVDSGTFYIDASNNRVGISTTTPNAPLQVIGAANVSGNVAIGGTLITTGATTLNGGLNLTGGNVNFDAGVLFVDATNNRVGVNNTTPDASLTVTGTANVSGNTIVGGTLTVVGNTRVGNTTTYVNMTSDGALTATKSFNIANSYLSSNTVLMTTSGANVAIDQFVANDYRTAKYIISYRSTSNSSVYGSTELLLSHNGVTVLTSEYATVFASNVAFSIDASIVGANCGVYASANQGNLIATLTRISIV